MNINAHLAHSKLSACVPKYCYAQHGSMPLANVSQPTRQSWTWVNTSPTFHQPAINQQRQTTTNHSHSHTEILGGHEHEWAWFLAQPWYLDEPTAVRQMKQKPKIEVHTSHCLRSASLLAPPPVLILHISLLIWRLSILVCED